MRRPRGRGAAPCDGACRGIRSTWCIRWPLPRRSKKNSARTAQDSATTPCVSRGRPRVLRSHSTVRSKHEGERRTRLRQTKGCQSTSCFSSSVVDLAYRQDRGVGYYTHFQHAHQRRHHICGREQPTSRVLSQGGRRLPHSSPASCASHCVRQQGPLSNSAAASAIAEHAGGT